MRSKSVTAIVWSLVLVGLMLGLGACVKKQPPSGSSGQSQTSQPAAPAAPAPAPTQAKINAADFLTKADAEAILGKPVGDPTLVGDGVITSNVSYITTADFTGISLFVRASTTPQSFERARTSSKDIAGVDPVPVANLGEDAYWSGGKMNQLHILKNQYWLIITVPSAGDKSLDMAKQAAEKILPRVP